MLPFKEKVYKATTELVQRNLILGSWGNISTIDRDRGIMIIKPHKTPFDKLRPGDMVVLDLNGKVIDGKEPSHDTITHLVIYKHFPQIGAIAHTHSIWATCWAQAGRPILPLGATHVDRFKGEIPCTRNLTDDEIMKDYEKSTGEVIVETFKNIDPMKVPAVLVQNHGTFIWGADVEDTLQNATVLEEIAQMAYYTTQLNPGVQPMKEELINRHYYRSKN